jgi:hypothetical protein
VATATQDRAVIQAAALDSEAAVTLDAAAIPEVFKRGAYYRHILHLDIPTGQSKQQMH